MRIFSTLFTSVLLLQTITAVKTTFGDDGEVTSVGTNYESSYPAQVTAPDESKIMFLSRN